MFFDLGTPIAAAANGAVAWLVAHWGDRLESAADAFLVLLLAIESALRAAPPLLILALVFAIALAARRTLLFAATSALLVWLVGCLGLWDQAMQTLAIVLVSLLLAVLLGIPLGVLAARAPRARAAMLPLLDFMQTIPSFVYLIPVAMLFGLGKVPAVLATTIYALPPLIRLTDLGIREVPQEVVQAGTSLGATDRQVLLRVQLPLSLPAIMQGINQTLMAALAMVVIASMIGARGIGETVLIGLQRNDPGLGLVGGLGIVLLAIVLDRISQAFGDRLQRHRG
jgi:glycine betaine/proline transport system permease protein